MAMVMPGLPHTPFYPTFHPFPPHFPPLSTPISPSFHPLFTPVSSFFTQGVPVWFRICPVDFFHQSAFVLHLDQFGRSFRLLFAT